MRKILQKNITLFANVHIGKNAQIDEYVILGKPPRGKKPGELPTLIGDHAIIRSSTVIYAGVTMGNHFSTGHGACIREDNRIGDRVSIGTGCHIEFGNRIGNGVRIHSGCFLERVSIEDDVFIGPHTVFTDDPHPMKCPYYQKCSRGAIVRRCAKIGAQVTLLPNIEIGRNALIGAGSVVVSSVAPNTVVAGNPAKPIGTIKNLRCPKGFFKKPYVWPPYK